jgi:RNA polymerase sigma factor (sigma-70 family)
VDRETQQPSIRDGDETDFLIESCIRGEREAWDRFVDRYSRLVYAVPSRLGLQSDACDDVFQNVFAIVLRELPRIRDRGSLPKWLITVAHRESYRWLRRWKAQSESDGSDVRPPLEMAPEPPEDALLRLERQQIILEGVEKLDGRCRDLLTALFLDPTQPDYRDVSRRLDIPVGSIGPTRNRCLRKLLVLLGDRLE